MKKTSRFLSILCACALLVSSMLCTAYAVGPETDETTTLQVVVVDPETNEQTIQTLEVAVPADATDQEAKNVKLAAAKAAAGIVETRSARAAQRVTFEDVEIGTMAGDDARITMNDDYNVAAILYESMRPGIATTLEVNVITADNTGIPPADGQHFRQ